MICGKCKYSNMFKTKVVDALWKNKEKLYKLNLHQLKVNLHRNTADECDLIDK